MTYGNSVMFNALYIYIRSTWYRNKIVVLSKRIPGNGYIPGRILGITPRNINHYEDYRSNHKRCSNPKRHSCLDCIHSAFRLMLVRELPVCY
jgi:hypothetical protein